MSQLSTFVTFCRNSLNNWVRREIMDDDPWDEQISNSLDSNPLEGEHLQKTPVMEPMLMPDLPPSSGRMIQQQ